MSRSPSDKPPSSKPTSRIEELARSMLPQAPAEPPIRLHPVPPPEPERKIPLLSSQECQKCKATFRWERPDSDRPKAPLVLRVQVGSRTCDCGYGRPRSERKPAAKPPTT